MPDWRKEIKSFIEDLNIDPAKEAEIVEELSQHLNDRYQDLVTQEIPGDQAHQKVMEEFNGGKLANELRSSIKRSPRRTVPDEPERRGNRMAEFWQNLRYGARVLRFNPGFAAIMILSLALGIGANTAIFQLLNAVRLRTLPVEKPEELANIKITKAPNGRTGRFTGNSPQLTNAIWELVRDQQQGFSKVAAWYSQRLNLNQGGEARYAQTLFVSGNFFDTLGIRPVIGRLISNADDQPSCGSRAAVIHESFWQREYGGNKAVLGRKINLAGRPFEITGVIPGSFFGMEVGRSFDIALPLCAEQFINAEEPFLKSLDTWWLAAVGRIKPDWKLDGASAQLATISRGIFAATTPTTYSATDKKSYIEMEFGAVPASNGLSNVRREYENPLWILLAISGFVLLIACANLANLMIARASARQKEMAVRLALGASRARLIRQMLSESLMLAVAGGLLGAALAQVLSRVLISFLSTERSVLFLDLQPDWRIILFTAGLAIFTCAFFGLMPAIQASRTAPGEAMKAYGRGNTSNRSRFESRRLLVVSQVALSLMLVVGALLFVRTFHNLTTLDAGFQQERLLISNFDFTPLNLPTEQRNAYKKQIREKIRSLRPVQSASSVAIAPLSGSGWNEFISVPDATVQRDIANFNQVSDGFFQTVGTRLIVGRDFNQTDTAESPLVAIVTQTFVNKFLKGQNPIGRTLRVAQAEGQPDRVFQIIGLVNDTKYTDLREEFTPIVFVPESQDKNPDQEALMIIRSNETLADVTTSIKRAVREMNPAIGLEFRLFRTMIRQGLLRERLMATLAGFFGFLAAILAMIGLYGVISYMVVRRKNEIGIRIALGANGQNILSMIMREATTLLIAGLALGTFLALITASAAKALIFGMQPNDPWTLILAVVVLAVIATLASFLPAKRASTLNPIQALREE
jgi:putative ABC transport system permease protein